MFPINRRKLASLVSATAIVSTLVVSVAAPTLAAKPTDFDNQTGKVTKTMDETGFDQYGYNHNANIFSGKADGVDKLWNNSAYGNDKLVMKWNQAWADAKYNGQPWTTDAWISNEWNGMKADGSGEVWHYKIQWVGQGPLTEGAVRVWGDFEVLMSHGTYSDALEGRIHEWATHALPNGYGN